MTRTRWCVGMRPGRSGRRWKSTAASCSRTCISAKTIGVRSEVEALQYRRGRTSQYFAGDPMGRPYSRHVRGRRTVSPLPDTLSRASCCCPIISEGCHRPMVFARLKSMQRCMVRRHAALQAPGMTGVCAPWKSTAASCSRTCISAKVSDAGIWRFVRSEVEALLQ